MNDTVYRNVTRSNYIQKENSTDISNVTLTNICKGKTKAY